MRYYCNYAAQSQCYFRINYEICKNFSIISFKIMAHKYSRIYEAIVDAKALFFFSYKITVPKDHYA